ncbi:hypothetical protein B4960_11345 [Listeria monocytogenes]|nr:hypothetical protein [Listeria monocytogenes]EAE6700067.1 hypothetical protein [Listeria monocytogenes]EAE7765911.1 hypothetical protein [Listeria monocytogenes]EAG2429590.1 hypothetical protein [Listeria monocytogenes]ECC0865831.1 hypothetical protein [Listeria monocytogenes]
MSGLIQKFLEGYGTTMYQVSKKTGMSNTTLLSANKKDVDRLSAKTIRAIAQSVGENPGKVLDDLIKMEDETGMVKNIKIEEDDEK